LFGFAVKGEEGRIPTGYEIKAYTDSDHRITIATADQPSPAEEWKRAQELQQQIERQAQQEKEERAKREKAQHSQEPPRQ
jgi:hypothetical protein